METWTLDHPELGRVEVQRGFDQEFAQLYPDWPAPDKNLRGADGEWKPVTQVPADAGLVDRAKAAFANPPARLQLLVNGQPVRRFDSVHNGRYPLARHLGKKLETPGMSMVDRSKPHVKITKGAFGDILEIYFHRGKEAVEFIPPVGSRGEARRQAMEESEFKRILYPLLTGLGKGGWALGVLVLGPIVARIFETIADWLARLFPDFQLPDLPPLPPLPDISLPVPHPPHISLPVPHWPEFHLPDMPKVPEWLQLIFEYSNVWLPIIVGIAVGILALRNHQKSERIRQQWNTADAPPGDAPRPARLRHGAPESAAGAQAAQATDE